MQSREADKKDAQSGRIHEALSQHQLLEEFVIPACNIPVVIFKVQNLYREGLHYDYDHFNPEILHDPYDNGEEVQAMRGLLYKFTNDYLDDRDVLELEKYAFPEADHLRAYLRFEKQAIEYAMLVQRYMLRLNESMKVTVRNNKEYCPKFFKHGEAPEGVKRLQKVLAGVAGDNVPASIIRRFAKVYEIFLAIKPSKTRPKLTEDFYQQNLQELKTIGFVNAAHDAGIRLSK